MPDTTWSDGEAYERYIGRWSRLVARPFLEWIGTPSGCRWIDVGCGTGTLCHAILERASPARVTGVEPSEAFLERARATTDDPRLELRLGSAEALPLPDQSAEAVVSGLVLNFLASPAVGLAEMARVCAPGGTVALYVWDYAGRMEVIRAFWDAARTLDPAARDLDEGMRFPTCAPERLRSALSNAGLVDVEARAIDVTATFRGFDDYWQPFLAGVGPAPAYAAALDGGRRERLRELLRERLPAAEDGTIRLRARAWAARAGRPPPQRAAPEAVRRRP